MLTPVLKYAVLAVTRMHNRYTPAVLALSEIDRVAAVALPNTEEMLETAETGAALGHDAAIT